MAIEDAAGDITSAIAKNTPQYIPWLAGYVIVGVLVFFVIRAFVKQSELVGKVVDQGQVVHGLAKEVENQTKWLTSIHSKMDRVFTELLQREKK